MQANPTPTAPAQDWSARRFVLATLVIVLVAAGFYLLWRFTTIFFIVFVAAVFATALRPAVLWLEKKGLPQRLGIVTMYLALLLVVAGVLGLLVPLLVEQGGGLVKTLPSYYTDLRAQMVGSSSLIVSRLGLRLPASLDAFRSSAAPADDSTVLAQVFAVLQGTSWALFGTLSVLLIAFFWILDRDQILKSVQLMTRIDHRPQAAVLWEEIESKVGGYIRGTAVLCLSIGVISGIAYVVIGVPSAIVLAVLAGILEAIPYVGPFLTAAIAVVVTLSQAPDKIWWVIGACVVIQQIENAVLVPRIMDKAVGVNAIVTLLAIAAFGSLLGVLGAIMAIPLAAVIQVLLDYWVLNHDAPPPVIEGRDKVALLRYQAQDLALDLRNRIKRDDSVDGPELDDIYEERIETLVGELDQMLVQLTAPQPSTVAPGA